MIRRKSEEVKSQSKPETPVENCLICMILEDSAVFRLPQQLDPSLDSATKTQVRLTS